MHNITYIPQEYMLETVEQDKSKTNNVKTEILIFSLHHPVDHPL